MLEKAARGNKYMKKYTKKVRIAIILSIVVSLIFSSMTVSYGATKTKRMNVYDEVIVKGNYAYCSTPEGLYKVNIDTLYKKRLIRSDEYTPISSMRIYKGYIYFFRGGPIMSNLYRMKLNGKNKKRLRQVCDYVISGGMIYYTTYNSSFTKTFRRVMKRNGKGVKVSKYNVCSKSKPTNKSGYRVREMTAKEYINDPNIEVADFNVCVLTRPGERPILLYTWYPEDEDEIEDND